MAKHKPPSSMTIPSDVDLGDDDSSSSSYGSGGLSSTAGQSEITESSRTPSLARSETRRVFHSKMIVFGVIVVFAIVSATITFLFTKKEEGLDFKAQFNTMAIEIVDAIHHEAHNVFEAADSFAFTLGSFTFATSLSQWPNVVIPDFESRGHKNNLLTKALQVTLVPLVSETNKKDWETFSSKNQNWIDEGLRVQEEFNTTHSQDGTAWTRLNEIPSKIWKLKDDERPAKQEQHRPEIDFGPGQYAPVWQQSPAPHDTSIINYDLFSHESFRRVYHVMWETKLPVISEVLDLGFLYQGAVKDDVDHPHSFLLHPIYSDMTKDPDRDSLVAFTATVIPWDIYLSRILPTGTNGILVVLHNSCNESLSYRIDGPVAKFLGEGDLHELQFDSLELKTSFAPFLEYNYTYTKEACEYDIRLYPTAELQDQFTTIRPLVYAAVVLLIFVATAMTFTVYDYWVTVRQDKVMANALRTNAIVKSLFPSNVRERLMKDAETAKEMEIQFSPRRRMLGMHVKTQLKDFLLDVDVDAPTVEGGDPDLNVHGSKPIADLFPEVTIMFADLVGFTAWSSIREPSQVFTLLETVFHAFDEIAKQRRVFKVETVGDCYVATAGLPEKRAGHAVVMARFARDCLHKANSLVKKLEVSLGPDTADLCMRIGLHSGQVTAGVLRGDKSRFQLFGDTMNTASRLESTGLANRIHVSSETAKLLIEAGKGHWVSPREDVVRAKGKGEIRTFWLDITKQRSASIRSGSTNDSEQDSTRNSCDIVLDSKVARLVEWNTDMMARLLREVVSRRNALAKLDRSYHMDSTEEVESVGRFGGNMVIDEVKEIIQLPEFDAEAAKAQEDPEHIVLDPIVLGQLRLLIENLASMYHSNPFHSFDHASHVTMSVLKLLSRIVSPEISLDQGIADELSAVEAHLHDYTFGITSDPLTQLACIFSALIHDVDHPGVSNTQLVKEGSTLAEHYKGKSVAEQNSVDLSWNLFMEPSFNELRALICPTAGELRRFRALVVNCVMATDIVDSDLKALRNDRWDVAFATSTDADNKDNVNRKATIVIEHLLQASDISHTMQHWHVYRKWNECLFHELYAAFKHGRAEKDPSEFWYKGEMAFFDFYVLPLARKLGDCGVFGVSSDEFLTYAQQNRHEWEHKGEEIVATYVEKYSKMYDSS